RDWSSDVCSSDLKANGYQSLHTTLKARSGVPIEIQIRTEEMEAMASNGIAAHWLYNSDEGESAARSNSRAQAWMGRLLEMQQKTVDSMEFIEKVKVDLFIDENYIFTPNGEINELPVDDTPVVFAYTVHTKVDNTCTSALIDGNADTLSTRLQSGQTVRILTDKAATPIPTWLNFVVTGKARSNIRHHLKNQQREDSIYLGERLLNQALSV